MKCINCGKKAVINNLCKDCFLERNPLIINIKKINMGNYNEIKKRFKNFIVFNPEYSETDFEVSININNHRLSIKNFAYSLGFKRRKR